MGPYRSPAGHCPPLPSHPRTCCASPGGGLFPPPTAILQCPLWAYQCASSLHPGTEFSPWCIFLVRRLLALSCWLRLACRISRAPLGQRCSLPGGTPLAHSETALPTSATWAFTERVASLADHHELSTPRGGRFSGCSPLLGPATSLVDIQVSYVCACEHGALTRPPKSTHQRVGSDFRRYRELCL